LYAGFRNLLFRESVIIAEAKVYILFNIKEVKKSMPCGLHGRIDIFLPGEQVTR
jgi:hypothetical protein